MNICPAVVAGCLRNGQADESHRSFPVLYGKVDLQKSDAIVFTMEGACYYQIKVFPDVYDYYHNLIALPLQTCPSDKDVGMYVSAL